MKIKDLNENLVNDDIYFDIVEINNVSFRILAYDKSFTPKDVGKYNFLEDYGAIGFIDIEYKGKLPYMMVDNIHILCSHRNLGIGYKLYNEALNLAKQKGYKGIASDPDERNIHTDHIWKKYSDGSRRGIDIIRKPIG